MDRNKIRKFFNFPSEVWICSFLVFATLVVYIQVGSFDFINYDTDLYVTENTNVKAGLSKTSISWAFTTIYAFNWHPLTWLSHMLDVQLYGLHSGRHHLTNVLLHIVNTLLLFGILRRMTGDLWRSGFVAALFALHPLHVESVAWVAERKDLLSTLFGMLVLWFFMLYVQSPGIGRYLLVLVFFILGLMAKPMIVTLPFVMLLLDYWPLQRFKHKLAEDIDNPAKYFYSKFFLIAEKIPLFIVSAASCVVTLYAQRAGGSIVPLDGYPLHLRISNALISYESYLGKMIWPENLSVIYPYNQVLPTWQVFAALFLIAGISLLAIKYFKSRPWYIVGWLWYLGTLVPVIGLVQVGMQSMADRYTYIPLIGMFIIIVWSISELLEHWRYKKLGFAVIALAAISLLMANSWKQVGYWKSSFTLLKRATEVTENNFVAWNILGNGLLMEGKLAEAIEHFKKSLEINPRYSKAHNNLGVALAQKGDANGAIFYFQKAIQIKPDYAEAHNNLGVALRGRVQMALAAQHFREAIRLYPAYAEAYNNMGILLMQQNKFKEASTFFNKALEKKPDFINARENLKRTLTYLEKFRNDIARLQHEQRRQPENPQICLELGSLYEEHGELSAAEEQYHKALSLKPGLLPAIKNLAIIQAAKGKYDSAIELFNGIIMQKPDQVEPYYYIAAIYSRQNKIDQSIHWLKKAMAKGYKDLENLRKDSNFNNIRNTSFYKKIIEDDLLSNYSMQAEENKSNELPGIKSAN